MYEHMTFDFILQRMLSRVPDTIDKREGSVIYDACAPAAAELAQMYIELDINYNLSFVDTASGEYLTRRTAEFGVNRAGATPAERKGLFYGESNAPVDVPLGGRYAIGELTFVAEEKIGTGVYKMVCETPGTVGNGQFGALLPIDYVANLSRAELSEVLVPGEDEEPDEELRRRFYVAVNEPAFGGNVADYKQRINAIPGVGATKVYPVWQGGGTVKCTIIAADWTPPSPTLVGEVQTIIDPAGNTGQGYGQAPIDHKVTITGVSGHTVNIETTLTLAPGVTPGQVQADVESVVASYLLELRKDWAGQNQLIIRTAQIDARILTVSGIEDVTGTTIDGFPTNLSLGSDEVPLPGTVKIHA
ncbi:baseplate J/gp47 family protein [Paenibacillus sp. alder61]|uniref:baseplate J/gp47 family protein n=1 Tax=Paenibacillus sp. alder61 TaxID=2862948 RepID=UPI001CD25809|nr:baseplate J/gp47 family protein [Paenibacillus sp. alder61]MCA1293117.1 baseplate J/gp47 family protein [Paenibacillus sp. alder61]